MITFDYTYRKYKSLSMPNSEYLSMFPLGIVTYPTVRLNLHIFEERYRELVKDAINNDINFGIVPVLEGGKMQEIGTEMKLINIETTYDDGRMDIKTRGIRRFKINSYHQNYNGKLYDAANVEFLETTYNADPELYQVIIDQIQMLFDIFDIDKKLPPITETLTAYNLVPHAALNIDQEIQFIGIDEEEERQLFIVEHLNDFIPKAREMEEMRVKVQLNGHFRNRLPPDLKEYP